uniref:Uncharacterized protein n=1 Tax=Chromera velia CCMP2878 TaxID=1169474 RepID=A0A0G4H4Y8_9ALVE|eukprot:Cvel_24701.t1-p1 / transcript=Cvel_24701.t1 / gene=Cvel_24701 / organism=Chromera_velia_CCMP2878 / gene_product=hypothetical protein / transcript_product=hypothetical protein / location=Cvel_scaffold2709:8734-9636(-) / protein_length=301 / sequence_SO=supercontig / SO=protein_coding / is_pseudo=false
MRLLVCALLPALFPGGEGFQASKFQFPRLSFRGLSEKETPARLGGILRGNAGSSETETRDGGGDLAQDATGESQTVDRSPEGGAAGAGEKMPMTEAEKVRARLAEVRAELGGLGVPQTEETEEDGEGQTQFAQTEPNASTNEFANLDSPETRASLVDSESALGARPGFEAGTQTKGEDEEGGETKVLSETERKIAQTENLIRRSEKRLKEIDEELQGTIRDIEELRSRLAEGKSVVSGIPLDMVSMSVEEKQEERQAREAMFVKINRRRGALSREGLSVRLELGTARVQLWVLQGQSLISG